MSKGIGARLRGYAEKDGRGYPDWAVRYVPVVRRLRPWLGAGVRALEVGANENGLSRFAGVRTVSVDIARDHLAAARAAQDVMPVVADIAALPFRDGAFDVAVCMDTFEHLDHATREAAAHQFLRVLADDGAAVIGFPAGEAAARAEAKVRGAYLRFCGRKLKWLEEHVAEGLPDADALIARFRRAAGDRRRVTSVKNANLVVWTLMWRILVCGWPGRGNALFQVLLRWATPLLCRVHFGACYRMVIYVEPGP